MQPATLYRSSLTNRSMTSPPKMARDDSSPRSLNTDGSRFESPSTAPTNYSPAETRGFGPVLESMFDRFSGMTMSSKVAVAQTDDPFTDDRSQPAYLSATAAPYQPTIRAPITELNANSTPERMSKQNHLQFSLPALGRAMDAPFGSPSAAASFNLPSSIPPFDMQTGTGSFKSQAAHNGVDNALTRPLQKQSASSFTSDPDGVEGSGTVSRYLCLSHVDPFDMDERNPRSRLAQFRQVRMPLFVLFLLPTPFPCQVDLYLQI
jgi:hypothetical protein